MLKEHYFHKNSREMALFLRKQKWAGERKHNYISFFSNEVWCKLGEIRTMHSCIKGIELYSLTKISNYTVAPQQNTIKIIINSINNNSGGVVYSSSIINLQV